MAVPRAVHRRMLSVEVQPLQPQPSPREPEDTPRETQTDAYGFSIAVTAAQRAALLDAAAAWAPFAPGGPLPPAAELKRLCRAGVPPALRPWVWAEVSGATRRRRARHPSYYAAMAELGRHESPLTHQISLDVPRTFPGNAWVQGARGQELLRRVLSAFAAHCPEVGYCQGMNYVAALLLLALGCDEEAAFWVLVSLIDGHDEGILYRDMYSRDLSGTHVEMRCLRALVDAKLPTLGAHLAETHCDISLVSTDWFLCLFSTALPAETAVRVWDALLLEGPKLLFRVALALLREAEPALLATDNAGDLLRAMRRSAAATHDREALMRDALKGVGGLPMERIRRYRQRNQRDVDREFAARETRAALRTAVANGFVITDRGACLKRSS
ncbi:hypothetical protein QBZ16_001394 [Prototheca wickerhamii]|uniref:Rab-GAP TBC domain-containing protein n=1 Tax=Prototheca wickerhamii TaxID=3111 RepID=A0AAD9IDQ1_PROWI|nr:hypothetical protein QBZ16_001394 [Prototheca wickerhamii]